MEGVVKLLVERHGISEEEAKEFLEKAIVTQEEMEEKMNGNFQKLAEALNYFDDELLNEDERQIHESIWDTRKKSQVINRKPLFIYARSSL